MIWALVALFAGQFETTFHDGLIALNQNNLAVAEAQLQQAAKLQPQNGRVWVALAQTYWKLQRPLETEGAVRNAERWGADDTVVSKALGVFYSEAGESYYFQVSQAHLQRQEFAAALQTTDKGLKTFDKSPQLELAAGVAYYGLRRFPEAMDAFLRTIELDSAVEQPYVFLGRMIDQAEQRLPRITQVFAAFAKRAPESYLANSLYGKALAMGGDADAERLLRKSIAENDAYWEPHFELGVLLSEQRKYEEAAREIRRSADLNPSEAAPHYHLARLYDRLGKTAEAAAERDLHARLTASGRPMAGIK